MSFPEWCGEYIGAQYEEDQCWDLVVEIYDREFGIRIGHYLEEAAYGNWQIKLPTDPVKIGDLLLFTSDGICHHVGVAVSSTEMIHLSQSVKAIVIENFTGSVWKNQLKKRYRHSFLNAI